MDSEVVEIDCWCFYVKFGLGRHLSRFDEYKWARQESGDFTVDLKINGKNVRVNLTENLAKNIDVYLVERPMDRSKEFKHHLSVRDGFNWSVQFYRKAFPTVPVIVVCQQSEFKYSSSYLKDAELNGDEMMTRKIGDKLVRELDAVKYIEYSGKSGRGAKVLIDEIAFAGIAKIKDDIAKIKNDEKQRIKRKCSIM